MLLSDLQNFLSGLQGGSEAGAAASGRTIDLANALNAESLDKIAVDADSFNKLSKWH